VWVEGHRDSVRTDSNGRFLLRVPTPGKYTLVARGETGIQRREVDVPATDFDLTLPGDDAPASRAKKTRELSLSRFNHEENDSLGPTPTTQSMECRGFPFQFVPYRSVVCLNTSPQVCTSTK
jgi:hypothetical protein